MQIIMPNATIMIIVSNLHMIHFTLEDDRHLVRVRTTPTPLIPPTIRVGSTTQTPIRAFGDMIVV